MVCPENGQSCITAYELTPNPWHEGAENAGPEIDGPNEVMSQDICCIF